MSIATPAGILYAFGSVWVASHHGYQLVRLDPVSGAVQAQVSGIGYQALTPFEGGGLVWVPSPTSLVAIDPQTDAVVRSIGGAFSDVGAFANGHVWIGDGQGGLLEIDPATGRTSRTLPGPRAGYEFCLSKAAFLGGSVWWSINGLVERIDPGTGKVTGTLTGVGDSFLTEAASGLWVAGNTGKVSMIDEATNTLADTITFGPSAPDNCAGPMSADGSTLWMVDDTDFNHIRSVDTDTGSVSGLIDPSGLDMQDLVVINGSVWTDFFDSHTVVRLDPPPPG